MDTDEYVIQGGADANEPRDENAEPRDVSATGDEHVPATSGGIDGAA